MNSQDPDNPARFYFRLVWPIPFRMAEATDKVLSALAVVTFFLLLVNQSLTQAVSSWKGVSPFWALVPIVSLVAYGLAAQNYRHYLAIWLEATRVKEDLEQLLEHRPRIIFGAPVLVPRQLLVRMWWTTPLGDVSTSPSVRSREDINVWRLPLTNHGSYAASVYVKLIDVTPDLPELVGVKLRCAAHDRVGVGFPDSFPLATGDTVYVDLFSATAGEDARKIYVHRADAHDGVDEILIESGRYVIHVGAFAEGTGAIGVFTVVRGNDLGEIEVVRSEDEPPYAI